MSGVLEYFIISFIAIFVIINPVTTGLVFNTLLFFRKQEERNVIAWRAATFATSVLLVFAFLGQHILSIFGISIGAFRIAGGIILFGIGMNMIKNVQGEHHQTEENPELDDDDVSIIPLAIPFISGPGAIATVLILTTEAPSIAHLAPVVAAIFVVTTLCYFAMRYSHVVASRIGETERRVITKVFGLILVVIAVQFVINGLLDVVPDVLDRAGLETPL